ncbi:MAG: 16S rRNA (uracil(1498)-N(3))-methyltransferase [Clostridia bacterium]|nr:16S rRNA (uracil(1498)-N(3))-methyltransferase [Clostridia bacterium]
MTRLFVEFSLKDKTELVLDEENSRYLSQVLRMRVDEELVVVDNSRIEYICAISQITKKEVTLSIRSSSLNCTEAPYDVTLFQSVSKGERMDYTIQKTTELGVKAIYPVLSERVIVKLSGKDVSGKIDRWQKISLEAARQSHRGMVPTIKEPIEFEDALKLAKDEFDLVLFPWEEESENGIKEALKSFSGKKIAVFVGPEGGYSTEEASKAVSYGAKSVTLGPRILRTETAGAAVLSMLIYELEL